MRRASSLVLSIGVVVATLAVAHGASAASASPVSDRLSKARDQQRAAEVALRDARASLDRALAAYARLQRQLDGTARSVVAAEIQQDAVDRALADAQQELDQRASAAYEAGPLLGIDLFLGSSSPADFAAAQEFAARAIALDGAAVDRVTQGRATLAALALERKARQGRLAAQIEALDVLAGRAREALSAAMVRAQESGRTVQALEKEQRALDLAQAAAEKSKDHVVGSSRGRDQSQLLALLGPTGGRTCEIPDGLVDTGKRLSGQSSWYGWDFAGQPTATGAIFDPRLFTVANKELPLNVFVRLHYQGRCAIALVNDRGPYGVAGRIFDASEAVAEYLGYKGAGVAQVTADVLIPAH